MALELQEERASDIPRNATLKVKVESTATSINATGRLDRPGGANDDWSHGVIFNRTKSSALDSAGIYIARVSLAFTGKKTAKAKVTFLIDDAAGNRIAEWSPPPEFEQKPKDMARAKYIIDVL